MYIFREATLPFLFLSPFSVGLAFILYIIFQNFPFEQAQVTYGSCRIIIFINTGGILKNNIFVQSNFFY